jgi:antitoxin component of MazEF toxin-antitoxin module
LQFKLQTSHMRLNKSINMRPPQKPVTKRKPGSQSLPPRKNNLSFITRLKPVGRSQAIVLPTKLIRMAGFNPGQELHIEIRKGMLIVRPEEEREINTDLKSWDRHFKSLKRQDAGPDENYFDELENENGQP